MGDTAATISGPKYICLPNIRKLIWNYGNNNASFFAHVHVFSSIDFHFNFCVWCVDSVLCLCIRGVDSLFFGELTFDRSPSRVSQGKFHLRNLEFEYIYIW